jgi:hypothetical protein
VGCFHLTGASCCDVGCVEKPIVAVGLRHLSLCQLLLLFGAFGLRVFGWCQEVCGPASPELEPQIEASCLAPETLEISPFHLCPSSEAHGCNLALRDHTQPIYKSKEVGVDLRPVNGVSNITCILMLTGEEAIMANNSVGWVLMSVAQINWPLRRRPSSSDGVRVPIPGNLREGIGVTRPRLEARTDRPGQGCSCPDATRSDARETIERGTRAGPAAGQGRPRIVDLMLALADDRSHPIHYKGATSHARGCGVLPSWRVPSHGCRLRAVRIETRRTALHFRKSDRWARHHQRAARAYPSL